jgi:hypothetical protein
MMAGMSIDMFIDPDPRSEPPPQGGELETLSGFLRWQRETFELKCSGLDAAGLARRSVEPSSILRDHGGRLARAADGTAGAVAPGVPALLARWRDW